MKLCIWLFVLIALTGCSKNKEDFNACESAAKESTKGTDMETGPLIAACMDRKGHKLANELSSPTRGRKFKPADFD